MKRTPLLSEESFLHDGIQFTAVGGNEYDQTVPQGESGGILLIFKHKGIRVLSQEGPFVAHCPYIAYSAPRQVWVETLKAVAKLKGLKNWRDVEYSGTLNDWIVREWTRIRGGIR